MEVIDARFAPNIPTRLAVVGSRTFNDFDLLERYIDEVRKQYPQINLIVSGGAIGADKLGERYAKKYNIATKIIYPQWNIHGRSAGIVRNMDIIINSDIVLAFWDGESKGTKDTISKAQLNGKLLMIVRF